jgi:uncharacterized protein with NAD-binding domain and iron-sulfur cluster
MWGGFYENAFHLIRDAYDELHEKDLAPGSPFQSWRDAFQPANFVPVMEKVDGKYRVWPILFLPNDEEPGTASILGEPYPTIWACFAMLLEGLVEHVIEHRSLDSHGTHANRLRWLVNAVTSASETVVCLFPGRHPFLLATIHAIQDVFESVIGLPIVRLGEQQDDDLRRLMMIIDTGLAALRGMAEDDVICQGFEVINNLDFSEWLAKHGATMPVNPVTLAMYDACFAYPEGNDTTPNLEAGTFLHSALRLVFTYKGAIFWRMMAGMGDTIFSPIYLVLKNRGVKFKFFHKVTQLHLTAGQSKIESIDLDVQATVKKGEYDPLVWVNGLPCWPSIPNLDQLVDGDRLKGTAENPYRNERFKNTDLESWWTDVPRVDKIALKRGQDFDDVVLGISLGALPYICQELVKADSHWADMIKNVRVARTRALQLWMNASAAKMGWKSGTCFTCPMETTERPVLGGYVEQYDTWSDMSHLIPMETFPEGSVQQIAYFCNTAPDDSDIPGFDDPEYPERALGIEQKFAVNFLNQYAQPIWTACTGPAVFDAFCLPENKGGRFVRINVDPNELYVQSVADTGKYRMPPGFTGFGNLVVAGDWTLNELNIGCVEAAVISGRMASQKLCGHPNKWYGAGGQRRSFAVAE